jgi:hypothetical protein
MKPTILLVLLPIIWACSAPADKTPVVAATPCQEGVYQPIHLPDGAEGAVICCQHRAMCYKGGTTVCGTYNILLGHDAVVQDFSTSAYPVEYVIQCTTPKKGG